MYVYIHIFMLRPGPEPERRRDFASHEPEPDAGGGERGTTVIRTCLQEEKKPQAEGEWSKRFVLGDRT